MKKAFTILVFVIGLAAVSVAQQAVITGRILDQNEKALPGANILIEKIGKGAVSDANGSLLYEYAGWLVRVSANFTTAFRDVNGIGESAFYDRWYDDQMFLDFNLGYSFAKNWQVFINARNLTNQPLALLSGGEGKKNAIRILQC